MNKHTRRILVFLLAALMLLGAALPILADSGDAEEELKYMAYNFYSGPDLSRTSRKFDSFMIDFKAEKTPFATYWSLANFGMDLSSAETLKHYAGISGYGAYAGLQNSTGRVGILSFWEARYRVGREEKILTATRQFPAGSSTFGGEGEGTNCIKPYDWKDNQWYRMLLHCWTDAETGTTFAGVWFLDVESGAWRLFAYFDTHLFDSCFIGAMSQFMENFSGGDVTCNCNVERNCFLKNMYVFDHVKKDWISLPTATLSYGDGGPQTEAQKKYGAHEFGATDEYFWGLTGGKVADQEAYERKAVKSKSYTIEQPDRPTFGAPVISSVFLGSKNRVEWKFADGSTPQLSYEIRMVNAAGETVYESFATRPDVHSVKVTVPEDRAVKCFLTVTDVFGASTTAEYATDEYKAATGTADPTPAPSGTEPAAPGAGTPKLQPAVIAAIACAGAAVIVAGVAVGVALANKKKKA